MLTVTSQKKHFIVHINHMHTPVGASLPREDNYVHVRFGRLNMSSGTPGACICVFTCIGFSIQLKKIAEFEFIRDCFLSLILNLRVFDVRVSHKCYDVNAILICKTA